MVRQFLRVIVSIVWASSLVAAQVRTDFIEITALHDAESLPLSCATPLAPGQQDGNSAEEEAGFPLEGGAPAYQCAIQTSAGSLDGMIEKSPFDGQGLGFQGPCGTSTIDAPPSDPNSAVGPFQVVQAVNHAFAIFDKSTGSVVYGPAGFRTLFQNPDIPHCATTDGVDAVVLYDKFANRWIITYLGGSDTATNTGYQCVAVSATADATQRWYRYAFGLQGIRIQDYTKIGVWSDAYYIVTDDATPNGLGVRRLCALNRDAMLTNQAAKAHCFDIPELSYGHVLPADLDGWVAPPAGSPNYMIGLGLGQYQNRLNMWRFHADFAGGQPMLTGPVFIPVFCYADGCPGCIPQKGVTQQLSSGTGFFMHRLAYRNFGSSQSLVVNHAVQVDDNGRVGVRWYEIRNPDSGTPTVYQQSTFAPDSSTNRFMGSIAMDRVGDIALGYSVSSAAIYPGIRYAGRRPGDALNQLAGERTIIDGMGSQMRHAVYLFIRSSCTLLSCHSSSGFSFSGLATEEYTKVRLLSCHSYSSVAGSSVSNFSALRAHHTSKRFPSRSPPSVRLVWH